MTIKSLNPYLTFDGTAAKALELYERALGAQRVAVMPMSEAPGMKLAAADAGRLMHAHVKIEGFDLMLSDAMPGTGPHLQGNVSVCVDFDDPVEMAKRFDALAVGGKVGYPLHDAFWGGTFGELTDAYGIRWMFNCEKRA